MKAKYLKKQLDNLDDNQNISIQLTDGVTYNIIDLKENNNTDEGFNLLISDFNELFFEYLEKRDMLLEELIDLDNEFKEVLIVDNIKEL